MRLIDADALIAHLKKDPLFGLVEKYGISGVIEAQLTVDAVPVRHGMWLPKHHYIAGHEFVSGHICSECGDDALNAEGDEFLTDYCPNCGADMRGEQDDESRSNSNAQTDTRARGMGATDKSSGI